MVTRRDQKSASDFFFISLFILFTIVFVTQNRIIFNQVLIKILRNFMGQSINTITSNDIQWFGLSYILSAYYIHYWTGKMVGLLRQRCLNTSITFFSFQPYLQTN